jgi:hypothetical protein
MVLIAAASLFFTTPAPLDMPRAEAYLVSTKKGVQRLEDRYDTLDLWTSRTVIGRWIDDDFRVFVLSRFDNTPPALTGEKATRSRYETELVTSDRRDAGQLAAMVQCLSPIEPAVEFARPRQTPRGLKDVRFWQGTNTTAIVCSFLPEGSPVWYLATWELSEGDDFEEMRQMFEREFLDKKAWLEVAEDRKPDKGRSSGKRKAPPGERELLRRDVRHGVAAYPSWHVTDSEEFTIVDALPARGFVEALTNDLPVMRRRYAEVMPSPLDGSNTLCVARIYADRDEYLEAAGEGMEWSAAFWNPRRRELVACMPSEGEAELLKTIRHEAFHQYFSYACSMIQSSPWLNEGYAQYFEDESDSKWGVNVTVADFDRLEELLPALFFMDYSSFYGGTDEDRRLKYRLAWSIAYFIEKGAPELRFQPFKDLKRNYIAALLETSDARLATSAAFDGSPDKLANFVAEWKKFWIKRM